MRFCEMNILSYVILAVAVTEQTLVMGNGLIVCVNIIYSNMVGFQ